MRLRNDVVAVLLCALLVISGRIAADAQVFVTPAGVARNVKFDLAENGVISITYDLESTDAGSVFTVVLEASNDRGSSFGMRPQALSGDVGPNISPGTGKRITWDSPKDVERVQFDQFRFRIIATGGQMQVRQDPSPPAAPPLSAPAGTPPASKKGSNKLIWVGVAGGGAAVAAALAAGGGGDPGPNPNPNPNTGTGTTTLLGSISASPSAGIAVVTTVTLNATWSSSLGSSVSYRWDFGDSSVETNTTPSVSHRYQGAGSFRVEVTATNTNSAIVGTANLPQVLISVLTGAYALRTSTGVVGSRGISLNQSGSSLNGDWTPRGDCTAAVSGSIASDGTVTFTMATFDNRSNCSAITRLPATFTGTPNATFDLFSGTFGGASATFSKCASNSVVTCS